MAKIQFLLRDIRKLKLNMRTCELQIERKGCQYCCEIKKAIIKNWKMKFHCVLEQLHIIWHFYYGVSGIEEVDKSICIILLFKLVL